jgi:hypothetical protein
VKPKKKTKPKKERVKILKKKFGLKKRNHTKKRKVKMLKKKFLV